MGPERANISFSSPCQRPFVVETTILQIWMHRNDRGSILSPPMVFLCRILILHLRCRSHDCPTYTLLARESFLGHLKNRLLRFTHLIHHSKTFGAYIHKWLSCGNSANSCQTPATMQSPSEATTWIETWTTELWTTFSVPHRFGGNAGGTMQ